MAGHALTNERFRGLFKNNFQLANLAIRLGRYYVRSGHEVTLDALLAEIRRNPGEDYVDHLKELEHVE